MRIEIISYNYQLSPRQKCGVVLCVNLRARQWAFTIIHRNSHSAAEYYKIPGDSVIELGAKVVCASACLRAPVGASLCVRRRRSSLDSGCSL